VSFVPERVRRAAEEILGNEALIEGLDSSAASELQNWGLLLAERIVQETHDLEEDAAEAANAPRLRALRKWLRLVRVWLLSQEEMTPETRNAQWERLLAQAREVYGAHVSLPPMDALTGKSPDDALKLLRSWLEPPMI